MPYSSQSFAHLRVDGLSQTFGDRHIFTNISFAVPHHDRVGVIGENGAGKSTLLRILAGKLSPDAGSVELLGHGGAGVAVGLLHQQPPFDPETTVEQVLRDSAAHLRQIAAQVDHAAQVMAQAPDDQEIAEEYATVLEQAERLGVWDLDARVDRIVAGVGLTDLPPQHTVGQLSGGQAARLALASLLVSAPEVLLLDEPTNHLDDAGIDFLSDVVQRWHGPVLIASHDRMFLDQTVVSLLDLDPAPRPHRLDESADDLVTLGVTRFTGTYSQYVEYKRAGRQRWQQQYQEEQAQLRRLRASVVEHQVVGHVDWKPRTEIRMAQKYYADRNARVVARRVNDARARLLTLEQRQVVKPPAPLTFQGLGVAAEQHLGQLSEEPIVVAHQVGVEGRLQPAVSLTIESRDRVLITGPNGSGKSTFLLVLAGQLKPDDGWLAKHPKVRVGLLPQESDFSPFHGHTVQAVYEHKIGHVLADKVPLSTYGLLRVRDQNRLVEQLSIGQQRRLALAILLADPPEALLLDEPTNHLSLDLVTQLEASFDQYPGALVVVSHDRWLREHWRHRVVEFMGHDDGAAGHQQPTQCDDQQQCAGEAPSFSKT